MPVRPFSILLLACVFLPVLTVHARATALPLQSFTLRGQVVSEDGEPLTGVRVVVEDHAETSVTTDDRGQYQLSIPMTDMGEFDKRAVRVQVNATRPGWSFSLPSGQTGLAIELRRIEREDRDRCEIKANDMRAVSVLAPALTIGAPAAAMNGLTFVGTQKKERPKKTSLRSRTVVVLGDPLQVRPDSAATKHPQGEASAPIDGSEDSAFGAVVSSGEPEAPVPYGRDADAAPSMESARHAGPRSSSAKYAHGKALEPRSASRVPAPPVASPTSQVEAAPVPPRPPTFTGSSVRAVGRNASGSMPRQIGNTGQGNSDGVVKLPGPGVTQSDDALIRRIEAGNGAASSLGSLIMPAEASPVEGECGCKIRGTVELHPDHLLTSRLSVVVSLRGRSMVRDTLELFMGSPRAFELPSVNCGTFDLDVRSNSRQPFQVVSADGRTPVDCRDGGLRQLRIVLDPR